MTSPTSNEQLNSFLQQLASRQVEFKRDLETAVITTQKVGEQVTLQVSAAMLEMFNKLRDEVRNTVINGAPGAAGARSSAGNADQNDLRDEDYDREGDPAAPAGRANLQETPEVWYRYNKEPLPKMGKHDTLEEMYDKCVADWAHIPQRDDEWKSLTFVKILENHPLYHLNVKRAGLRLKTGERNEYGMRKSFHKFAQEAIRVARGLTSQAASEHAWMNLKQHPDDDVDLFINQAWQIHRLAFPRENCQHFVRHVRIKLVSRRLQEVLENELRMAESAGREIQFKGIQHVVLQTAQFANEVLSQEDRKRGNYAGLRTRQTHDYMEWYRQDRQGLSANRLEPMDIGRLASGGSSSGGMAGQEAADTEAAEQGVAGHASINRGVTRRTCHHCKKSGHLKKDCHFFKDKIISFEKFVQKYREQCKRAGQTCPSDEGRLSKLYSEAAQKHRTQKKRMDGGQAGRGQEILTPEDEELLPTVNVNDSGGTPQPGGSGEPNEPGRFIRYMSTDVGAGSCVRIRLPCMKVLASAILDTGNQYDDVCSIDFARATRLPIQPLDARSAVPPRTANGANLRPLGRLPAMKIFVEGIPLAMEISPVVLQDMQLPLNLSLDFIRKNELAIVAENMQLHVKYQGFQVPWRGSWRVLEPLESCDPQFNKLLEDISKTEKEEVRGRTRGLYYSGGHLGGSGKGYGRQATALMDKTNKVPTPDGKWMVVSNECRQNGESAVDPAGCPTFQGQSTSRMERVLVSGKQRKSQLLVLNGLNKPKKPFVGQPVRHSFPVKVCYKERTSTPGRCGKERASTPGRA